MTIIEIAHVSGVSLLKNTYDTNSGFVVIPRKGESLTINDFMVNDTDEYIVKDVTTNYTTSYEVGLTVHVVVTIDDKDD